MGGVYKPEPRLDQRIITKPGSNVNSLSPTAFDQLMQQLGALPLWIKQVIQAQLRTELEITLSKATLDAFGPEHTLQFWQPELSHSGQHELERPSGQYDQNTLRLLYLCRFRKDVVFISILNNWSLEDCAKILSHAIERELIMPPRSAVIGSTIQFILGQIRLGEYLVNIGRLSGDQLEQALHTQRAIEEAMGERTGIANVLINLGYIRKEDSEAILFLKEESRRNFQWGNSTQSPEAQAMINQLRAQLQQAVNRVRELEQINQKMQAQIQQRP
jgi:hypothetical protein